MPLTFRLNKDPSKRLGEGATREFAACGGTIGRSLENDWVLPDPNRYISGRHAMIDFQAGAYYIVDMSRNGVYVNGADTPVGRGHPQRLFDGDSLRFGEFEFDVEITDDPPSAIDDGMRDSIVRAQLVPEDESMELAMLTEDKLVMDGSLARHLEPQAATSGSRALHPAAIPAEQSDTAYERDAANVILEAAGLDANALTGVPPRQILEQSGALLAALTEGLIRLGARIADQKAKAGVGAETNPRATRNPIDQAADAAEALATLLTDRRDAGGSSTACIADAFDAAGVHDTALYEAIRAALEDSLDRFDPAEIASRYDDAVKPHFLRPVRESRYWNHYAEVFATVTHRGETGLPKIFSDAFSRAYLEERRSKEATVIRKKP